VPTLLAVCIRCLSCKSFTEPGRKTVLYWARSKNCGILRKKYFKSNLRVYVEQKWCALPLAFFLSFLLSASYFLFLSVCARGQLEARPLINRLHYLHSKHALHCYGWHTGWPSEAPPIRWTSFADRLKAVPLWSTRLSLCCVMLCHRYGSCTWSYVLACLKYLPCASDWIFDLLCIRWSAVFRVDLLRLRWSAVYTVPQLPRYLICCVYGATITTIFDLLCIRCHNYHGVWSAVYTVPQLPRYLICCVYGGTITTILDLLCIRCHNYHGIWSAVYTVAQLPRYLICCV